MNETPLLSFVHKAKLVSLAGYGWKMNERLVIALIGTIIMVSLLHVYLIPAYGMSQDMIKPSIKQISKTKIDSSYLYLFEYCSSPKIPDMAGFLVISNVESVPVLIAPGNKEGCQTYGAKVQTDKSEFVKTKLFTNNDLSNIIQDFENKKITLEDKMVKEQQKLIKYYKTDSSEEKKAEQVSKIEFLGKLIKSARSSIILLKSVG
jgi:hypothetical protein